MACLAFINLILMDPCIVDYSVEIPIRCSFVIEFINFYLLIINSIVARMGEDRGVYRLLVGKTEGKRPLWRPRHRWEDNIKMDLQEVGGVRGDWMELAEDRDRWRALVGTVRNFSGSINAGIS
jgi:hypothetical protein